MSNRMGEAEVSIRLAVHLVQSGLAVDPVRIAIDGAQAQILSTTVFDVASFLAAQDWRAEGSVTWRGTYTHPSHKQSIEIHSRPGLGDVVANLASGRVLRAECKKGPLIASKSSAEYPLLREALGQLLTIERVSGSDLLAVAVPSSPKFEALAERWRRAPLIQRFGIQIITVSNKGVVSGLNAAA